MLKIRIVAVGEHKDRWVTEACEHFTKLISRWATVETRIISSRKESPSLTPSQIKDREAEKIARELGKGKTIALCAGGKRMDSAAFAETVRRLELASSGIVTFVIGGAHGLSQQILDRADGVYSLSPLTFTHQLARIVLLEQLYRAHAIIHGTSYHK